MLFTLKDQLFGDITIIRVGQEYHLFTEQSTVGLPAAQFAGARTIGHAVSKDLFHWEELPPTIGCGPKGAFDGYTIYHMDVFHHAGTFCMYYTGLDKHGPGEQQSVGLATSRDGIRWEKCPSNPVLRADPRWYEPAIPRAATYQEKDFGRLWFRDPCVVRNPKTGRFGMIVIARDVRRPLDVRGCLAWATSDDLVRWKPHPPIFSPGRFHTIETPSIFERGGRWYIIYMSHGDWGPPVMTTDPYQDGGDFYAISDGDWTGPYRRPADEVLIAAHRHMRVGAARTVDMPDGERLLYSWLHMRPHGDDTKPNIVHPMTMPTLKRVRFDRDGAMRTCYYEKIESFCKPLKLPASGPKPARTEKTFWRRDGGIVGKHFSGRTIASFGGQQPNVIFSARIRFLRGERAGLALRLGEGDKTGWQVVADRRFGRIEFGTLDGAGFIDARSWSPRDEVELKVVADRESLEVYADDRFMIHQVRYRETTGRVGFLVDRAEARFDKPRMLRFTK